MRIARSYILLIVLALTASTQAGLIRTLDGKSYQGEITFDSPGVLSITAANVKTNIPLADILQANFRLRSTNQLPSPWQLDDIGDVSPGSSASFTGAVFALRGAAGSDSSQFVHRPLVGADRFGGVVDLEVEIAYPVVER